MLFNYERKITIFSDKVQLKRLVANRSTLEETLKEAQVEGTIRGNRLKYHPSASFL